MQNSPTINDQINQKVWLTQSDYVKKIRPLLPPEAFVPDQDRVWILLINLAILLAGWSIASYLDQWSWYWLWLYLPFSLIMGNSVIILLFSTHELMHSKLVKNLRLRQVLSLLGLTMLWMPPTLWRAVHNLR